MMLSVLEAIDSEPATLFVEYEAVTCDPPGQARRLATFLDQQWPLPAARQPSLAWPGVCKHGLRRNRDGQRHEELMTAPQRSLYQFLRQKVHQPGIPVTDDYPMSPGWRDLVTTEETPR